MPNRRYSTKLNWLIPKNRWCKKLNFGFSIHQMRFLDWCRLKIPLHICDIWHSCMFCSIKIITRMHSCWCFPSQRSEQIEAKTKRSTFCRRNSRNILSLMKSNALLFKFLLNFLKDSIQNKWAFAQVTVWLQSEDQVLMCWLLFHSAFSFHLLCNFFPKNVCSQWSLIIRMSGQIAQIIPESMSIYLDAMKCDLIKQTDRYI